MAAFTFSDDRQPIAAMRAADYRPSRDLVVVGVLAAAAVGLLTVGLPLGERIIPLTAVAAIAIGWARSFREAWAIGDGWIGYRRWFGTHDAPLDQLRSIDLVTDVDDRVDAIVFVTDRKRLPVPLHELRDHTEFTAELREFVAAAVANSVAGAIEASAILR